jgi:hypothetical protein
MIIPNNFKEEFDNKVINYGHSFNLNYYSKIKLSIPGKWINIQGFQHVEIPENDFDSILEKIHQRIKVKIAINMKSNNKEFFH